MGTVIVSNRVARSKGGDVMAGGLAAALFPAVRTAGAVWVGTSGRLRDYARKEPRVAHWEPVVEVEPLGKGALALVDMPATQYAGFYEGFANSVLWPALHSRVDLIRANAADYASYRDVNAFMANALTRFAKPDNIFWVHDYHYIPLAAELRKLGVERPIGFFLHTPLPEAATLSSIPRHRELLASLLAYDLIGFQTAQDRDNFARYVAQVLGRPVLGDVVPGERRTRLGVFPIGIDVDTFASRATKAVAGAEATRLRASLDGAKLAISVDRLDYSKGLLNRFHAVDRMLEADAGLKRTVTFLQIGVPTREAIDTYCRLQKDVATLVGEINGRHGEVDWVPIRYLSKGFSQSTLTGFYRTAQIGLVTPMHDGMNLVAKEYVAAQNPFDPGILILSEFAGAARQLDAAILVNPHDVDAMARAMAKALVMPQEERRERWEAMMATLRNSPVQAWFTDFVDALTDVRPVELVEGPNMVPSMVRSATDRAANVH